MSQSAAPSDFVVKPFDARFVLRIFAVLAFLAALSAAILIAGKLYGRVIALGGHTDDTTLRDFVIGNNVLSIPANMLRLEDQRQGGEFNKVELYLSWPDMAGYTRDKADDFNHKGGRRSLIFITFEPSIMSRDMSGRVEPIYDAVIAKPGIAGPAGTTMYGFAERSGYLDELLVTAPRNADTPFAARCLAGAEAERSLAPCERDIQVGDNLSLTYRFPKEMLGEWQRLDAAVLTAASRFLRTAN